MFGKQKNITKEITNLNNQQIELRRKLFEAIALELAKLECPGSSKRDLSVLIHKYKEAFLQKYSNWTLQDLGAILNSIKTTNYTRASQVGIVFNKRHIAYLEGPEVFEIQNLTLPKKIHHHEFKCKDFALEEIIFMTISNTVSPIKPEFLKLYVLVNTNTSEIYAVMPPNHKFHKPKSGIYTLLDTATFPNSNRFVLGATTKISSFGHLQNMQGSKIVLDTKHNSITKLGVKKIQNMRTSQDGQITAFSILRPTKIFTRQYIDLATGKYIQAPMLALTEPTAPSLSAAEKVELLRKIPNKRFLDPAVLGNTFRGYEKFDGKPVPETHFVVQNSFGETFLTGKADLKDLPIIKALDGRLIVQVDYPQSIITEEVYGTQGQLFNKQYFDYNGTRLKKEVLEDTTFTVEPPKQKGMFEDAPTLEF